MANQKYLEEYVKASDSGLNADNITDFFKDLSVAALQIYGQDFEIIRCEHKRQWLMAKESQKIQEDIGLDFEIQNRGLNDIGDAYPDKFPNQTEVEITKQGRDKIIYFVDEKKLATILNRDGDKTKFIEELGNAHIFVVDTNEYQIQELKIEGQNLVKQSKIYQSLAEVLQEVQNRPSNKVLHPNAEASLGQKAKCCTIL